ncbi:Uncharacterized protein dnl_45200 [Desulfonema limicola]|uniref:Uncharacterized protein n=1 Tax=Desulfonema limicola TaxID=45656 RepID=A0A975GIP6_9BACT|nr:hypothetical protein [Desulfonema limicola]QTA82153.1 Uncharacterized protein dnl_45200 [Desulfonema limicola]
MPTTEINRVIEGFNLLPPEEKEYVAQMIHRQFIEYRREEILQQAKEAMNDFKQGNVKSGSLQDIYKDLEDDESY